MRRPIDRGRCRRRCLVEKIWHLPTDGAIKGHMSTTGRKTVKGAKTSAPKTIRATSTKASATDATETSAKPRPTHEEIAKRSYEIYLARAGAPGDALADWAQAERELG